MPILKSKSLRTGVVGEYWRILYVGVKVDTLETTFQLGLFIDKSASDTGKAPLSQNKKFTFVFTVEELMSGNLLGLGDAKILEKANSTVEPLFDLGESHPFDLDLSNGEIVE